MKGIVPAAGKGTRLRPLTRSIPKEMIRVGTKPVIEHSISVLKAGGILDILVIVGLNKGAILDYLGSGEQLGVNISYKVQERLSGTGGAVYQGKKWIGEKDFTVIYGDNYFRPYTIMKKMIKFHKKKGGYATILLSKVKDPRRFGIVKLSDDKKILGIIEKPSFKEAEPYKVNEMFWINSGLLILNPLIFDYIEKTKPEKGGEVWITNSIKNMKEDGYPIYGYMFEGNRYDISNFNSLKRVDKLEQKRLKKK